METYNGSRLQNFSDASLIYLTYDDVRHRDVQFACRDGNCVFAK